MRQRSGDPDKRGQARLSVMCSCHPYGLSQGSHLIIVQLRNGYGNGYVELTIVDGVVVSEFNTLTHDAVVNIDSINELVRRGWLGWQGIEWDRIVSACISYPNAGSGHEEEFMMG